MIAHRSRVFFLMFSITMLLNINFTILKSVRNTLAVVDLGIGASTIPIFELFGALPCSILMTWGLSLLMQDFYTQSIFDCHGHFFRLFSHFCNGAISCPRKSQAKRRNWNGHITNIFHVILCNG